MQHEVQDQILAILSQCHDMAIGTVRPDGAPQVTVVSFVHDGMLIYFGCGVNSQKATNIAREARVSVALTAPYADWMAIRGLSLAAEAEEVRDPGELGLVWRLMNERFPQFADIEAPRLAASDSSVRVRRCGKTASRSRAAADLHFGVMRRMPCTRFMPCRK